jgi:hypothetical protein
MTTKSNSSFFTGWSFSDVEAGDGSVAPVLGVRGRGRVGN